MNVTVNGNINVSFNIYPDQYSSDMECDECECIVEQEQQQQEEQPDIHIDFDAVVNPVNDDLTSEIMDALVGQIFDLINNSSEPVKRALNANAEEFVPVIKQEPVKQEPVKQEPMDESEKRDLFKQICEENDDNFTDALFQKYLKWDRTTKNPVNSRSKRPMNRYQKMQHFLNTQA
jgi:hypothetical protein